MKGQPLQQQQQQQKSRCCSTWRHNDPVLVFFRNQEDGISAICVCLPDLLSSDTYTVAKMY
jgi:hypothetical protein